MKKSITNPIDILEQRFKATIKRMPKEFTFHRFARTLARLHQHEYIDSLVHFVGLKQPFRALHAELERRLHTGSYRLALVNNKEPSEDIFGTQSHCGKWRKPS
jgi:hypothetical protein